MTGPSRFFQQRLLGELLHAEVPQRIPRIWVSLHTDDPGEDGIYEVGTWTGYARAEATGKFMYPDILTRVPNTQEITFPVATSVYDFSFWGLWFISSEGAITEAFLLGGPLGTKYTSQIGKQPYFPPGSLIIGVS